MYNGCLVRQMGHVCCASCLLDDLSHKASVPVCAPFGYKIVRWTILLYAKCPLRVQVPFNKKITSIPDGIKVIWCGKWDLNPYVVRHTPLKRACLPIPALPHIMLLMTISNPRPRMSVKGRIVIHSTKCYIQLT